jgi:hypothetical protein
VEGMIIGIIVEEVVRGMSKGETNFQRTKRDHVMQGINRGHVNNVTRHGRFTCGDMSHHMLSRGSAFQFPQALDTFGRLLRIQ